jgi:hypothetical protein
LFGPEDLHPVDPLEYVRRNQGRFFRGGAYDPIEAAALIVGEALRRGATDVRVRSERGWLIIEAERDWLGPLADRAFAGAVPFPEAGPNSMLSEVLLMAFAQSVVTATSSAHTIVKGDSPGPLVDRTWSFERAVAFSTDATLDTATSS